MAAYAKIGQLLYIGASTDTKPTSVEIGTRCYETNTKKWYITADGTNYVEMQDLDAIILGAGSEIIGKVGIDQTTDGTTNAVHLTAGSNLVGKVNHGLTGIGDNRKTVTTAGVRETLVATSTPAKYVKLIGLSTNTNPVVWGGSTVVAAAGTRRGQALNALEASDWVPIDDLVDIYLDVVTNGEGVSFVYLT